MFNLVNKYKYLLPIVYTIIGLLLISVLSVFAYAQYKCTTCTLATVNPSFFLMPLLAYGSIGLVGLTIGFNRKTASEKNALDFDKAMSELTESFKVIGEVRKTLVSHDSKLDRRKAYGFMQDLEGAVKAEKEKAQAAVPVPPASSTPAAAPNFAFMMLNSSTKEQGSNSFIFFSTGVDGAGSTDAGSGSAVGVAAVASAPAAAGVASAVSIASSPGVAGITGVTGSSGLATTAPTATEVWQAAGKILNAFEGCANAIRYGIYDEDLIYNVYGSQFINFYELIYGLMKSRQREFPRAWVNFEWLAVKWTLRRKITGVTSKEWEETSYIIQESLVAIKEHTKVRPNPEKLQTFMNKLERRKFPA
ncbi:DUF4760 domain-containing protein [Pseudomonas palmensis]|uniref:DUF4760 domain-containing protein n=1 Tax=Pseudomonas palmensis TaxID=2815362 RepID=UPI001AE7C4B4|nr:DUF4760 domain-containing protein [Pseudomonas palmensis]